MTLEREIHEQPAVLTRLLDSQAATIRAIAARVRSRRLRTVFLAARGSSDNAGLYAKYVWGIHNALPIALAAPSLFSVYRRPPAIGDALVVGISQSGQSPDIVGVIEEGRRQGAETLAIVNAPDSPLARAAESVIDISAGDERAVAATKTYTAQLMAVAMFSAALAEDGARWDELSHVPAAVAQVLEHEPAIASRAERYRFMSHCVVLGRGFNYATAFEWALKLKELSYVVAEPYSSADFQHGPMALLERGFPVLAAAPGDAVFEDTLALLRRMVDERLIELLVLSDRDEALEIANTPVRLPAGIAEWLTPIVTVVAAQLFCLHLTRAKGLDTESPRGLKKVTLTH
jgi:glutamine---fructose-6-phosphate transaminase (isomerizing)